MAQVITDKGSWFFLTHDHINPDYEYWLWEGDDKRILARFSPAGFGGVVGPLRQGGVPDWPEEIKQRQREYERKNPRS